jgi:hypothetical protein
VARSGSARPRRSVPFDAANEFDGSTNLLIGTGRLQYSLDVTTIPNSTLPTHLSSLPLRPTYRTNKSPEIAVVNPRTQSAWQSILNKASNVVIEDLRIENPHLAQDGNDLDPANPAPPETGFMLEGTINLFGLESHPVTFRSWHGPPPGGVEVGSDIPVYQSVKVDSVSLADLIPMLEGTPLAKFHMKDITITYQNYIL